jgi:drug/metabolite transporter (DMT)-like permease
VSGIEARVRLALFAAAAVGVQVGAAIVASRWLVRDLGPSSLAFLRYLVGAASLVPIVALMREPWSLAAPLRERLAVAGLGIGQFGLLIALLNLGLTRLDAALGALIFATFPLVTLLLSVLIGRERFNAMALFATVLTVAGVGLALGVQAPAVADGAGFAFGAGCVLLATLIGAVCVLAYRPYLERHPTLTLGLWAMSASVLAIAPFALAEGLLARAAALSTGQWAAVVGVGLSSGVGYWLWLWALKHATPSRVTMFLALSPITATLLGTWWLGEQLEAAAWLGIACVAIGLGLGRRTSPARVFKPPSSAGP